MFEIVPEMKKLRNWLDEQKIDWIDDSDNLKDFFMCRTHFSYNNKCISVVNGYGSYGGIPFGENSKNIGFLEFYDMETVPKGWLTCDDVIELLKKYY